MTDFVKNPYFHPVKDTFSPQEEVPQVEESKEFKQYEPEGDQNLYQEGLTSIIIPAYFSSYPIFHMTGNCIGSIREHTKAGDYEIILVINERNGIIPEDLSVLKADKVIVNETNEGFAKAVNKGIRVSKGEYIAIVNNDVQVFDYWLDDMKDALNHTDLVMATPMYGMPYARAVEAEELRNKELNLDIKETFSDFTDFSCVLTKKALFDEIGLFDEEFFMYGEDLDFLRRIKQAGKTYASTKRVNTHHVIGATSMSIDKTPEIMNESKEVLKRKYPEEK